MNSLPSYLQIRAASLFLARAGSGKAVFSLQVLAAEDGRQ